MRVLFAQMCCSLAATLAAGGVQTNTDVDGSWPAWSASHDPIAMAPMDRTLELASVVHLTIDRTPTQPARKGPAPAGSGSMTEVAASPAPSMLQSFDIAVFSDPESQPAEPVRFVSASAIPAPASLVLLVLGGLIALRR